MRGPVGEFAFGSEAGGDVLHSRDPTDVTIAFGKGDDEKPQPRRLIVHGRQGRLSLTSSGAGRGDRFLHGLSVVRVDLFEPAPPAEMGEAGLEQAEGYVIGEHQEVFGVGAEHADGERLGEGGEAFLGRGDHGRLVVDVSQPQHAGVQCGIVGPAEDGDLEATPGPIFMAGTHDDRLLEIRSVSSPCQQIEHGGQIVRVNALRDVHPGPLVRAEPEHPAWTTKRRHDGAITADQQHPFREIGRQQVDHRRAMHSTVTRH